MRHPLTELFHFSNLFQVSNDYRMSILTSSAISCVVLRGSALVIALNWSLSTFNSQPIHSSSSRLSSPLQNFLNHHRTVCSLAVPGPNALLMLRVISVALTTQKIQTTLSENGQKTKTNISPKKTYRWPTDT